MTSTADLPGFNAVPALMTPQLTWPGVPYQAIQESPAFTAGTPYLRWVTGEPCLGSAGAAIQ